MKPELLNKKLFMPPHNDNDDNKLNLTQREQPNKNASCPRPRRFLRHIESGYWWYVGRIETATDLVSRWYAKAAQPVSYLDLGCGTGGFASAMQSRFPFRKKAMIDGDAS